LIAVEYKQAEKEIKKILGKHNHETAMAYVVDFLYSSFPHYHWIGVYLIDGNQLVLGPWKGKHATEHTTIPIGKGICGSAAMTGKTERIDDVSKDTRYLSCFLSTRSEIVVPIKKEKKVIGEIDIDSDVPAAFTRQDVKFLEKIADMLSQHI
jgi:L-methionine (R)-S-oxide reductase